LKKALLYRNHNRKL